MKLFWKSYGILFFFTSLGQLLYFSSNESAERLYYLMMMSFNKIYVLAYLLNVLNILLTSASAVIVLFYAFNIPWAKHIALNLLYLRILAELTGHHYDIKTIQSSFAQNQQTGILNIIAVIFPIIPSYIAHWRYAKS